MRRDLFYKICEFLSFVLICCEFTCSRHAVVCLKINLFGLVPYT